MSTINDHFIQASRKKLRFPSTRGALNVEDLWDLSLESLDTTAQALDQQVQRAGQKSFIKKKEPADALGELALAIVVHIIETKQAEAEAAKVRKTNQQQREFLSDLLQRKKLAELESLPVEDIEKQIAALAE